MVSYPMPCDTDFPLRAFSAMQIPPVASFISRCGGIRFFSLLTIARQTQTRMSPRSWAAFISEATRSLSASSTSRGFSRVLIVLMSRKSTRSHRFQEKSAEGLVFPIVETFQELCFVSLTDHCCRDIMATIEFHTKAQCMIW